MNDGTQASSFRTLPRESPHTARSSPLGPGGRDEATRTVVNFASLPELPQLQYYWTGAQAKGGALVCKTRS